MTACLSLPRAGAPSPARIAARTPLLQQVFLQRLGLRVLTAIPGNTDIQRLQGVEVYIALWK